MLISKKDYLVTGKEEAVVKQTKQSSWTQDEIYLKDENGLAYTLAVRNKNIFNKAEIGKRYKLIYVLDIWCRATINDIELVK